MKLRNKKTGEIVEVESCNSTTGTIGLFFAEGRECDRAYNSLAELNEEWEDYEEPKEYWYINTILNRVESNYRDSNDVEGDKAIGNYFETREEAKKTVEKLKAWKRLKDKGFKVDLWDYDGSDSQGRIRTGRILFRVKDYEENDKDLDLLFGGEE